VSLLTQVAVSKFPVEDAGGGIFTSLVVDALQGGAADILGDVTAPSVYAYLEAALGAWDQRHYSNLMSRSWYLYEDVHPP